MRCRLLLSSILSVAFLLLVVPAPAAAGQDAEKQDENAGEETEKEKVLRLEDIFPEDSFFGPSARSTSFSHDGRYGAYLYRPYKERRHGNDLWLLDTQSGETVRATSVVVMSEFQEDTRKVKEDREEKAKRAAGKGEKKDDAGGTDAASDDPVSGTWEGRVRGGDDQDIIPPDGVAVELRLQLHEDGSVTGMLSNEGLGLSISVSGGRYDAESGELTAQLIDDEAGQAAALSVTIKDDEMSGTIEVEGLGATFEFEAKRTEKPAAEDDAESDTDEENDEEEKEEDDDSEVELGNRVGDDDADDDDAPRYSGIQSYVWSPNANEMIFTSQGDLYRFNVEDKSIVRLTRTRGSKRGVEYLPDGSGYTYMDGNAIIQVSFDSHLVEQLDPQIPGGEDMIGYELSPDGSRLVFLTRRVKSPQATRTVNIISYRDRFAQVRQVPRHVSDDALQEAETSIWLYDMRDPWVEETSLKKVYTHEYTGPRDILQVPEWAPDSSKVGFAVFTQKTGLVEIYHAGFEKPEAKDDDDAEEDEEDGESADENDEQDEVEISEAKVVYRFFHNGGPNTPRMIHPYFLADSRHMVFLSEQSGYRHVHILDPVYESLEQVTAGPYEVYPFDISKDHRYLFATATKEHPTREDVYVIDLQEKAMKRLSKEDGVYSTVAISNDGAKALANHIRYGDLRELQYIDSAKGEQRELTDSHPELASKMTEPAPEFFTYENRHGHTIHGHMFKPDDWTPDDKRPLLLYVYGGPLGTRKQVVDGSYSSALYFFAYYMTKKYGYITCTIDPRGVSGYGGLFEKANFEQVGKPQTEDLVDGMKWMIENHGVDPDRVGMHGWSFGGFQTQMCMYTEPEVFACGIAGAGPTEWENYNSWYSQGTIGETDEGTAELKKYSLLPLAKNLKGELLLVHGMEDSNVLYQDTVRVYRELLKAGKEHLVELFLDPTGGHGLGGDVKTINRYRKYEEFLLRCLGTADQQPPVNLVVEEKKEKEDQDD